MQPSSIICLRRHRRGRTRSWKSASQTSISIRNSLKNRVTGSEISATRRGTQASLSAFVPLRVFSCAPNASYRKLKKIGLRWVLQLAETAYSGQPTSPSACASTCFVCLGHCDHQQFTRDEQRIQTT